MSRLLMLLIVVPLTLMASVERELTDEQIASVYTDEMEIVSGKEVPVTYPPKVEDFKFEEAPVEYSEEYGKFTSISELTGYLNVGVTPTEEFKTIIVKSFENVSDWKTIKNAKGTKDIFADTYVMDSSNKRLADNSDGSAPASGETRRINMVIKLMGLKLPIISDLTISEDNGLINVSIDSVEPVKVPIIGTMMDVGGFRLNLQFVEYLNGYIAKGYTVSALTKLEGGFEPSIVSEIIVQFFERIKKNLTK